MIGREFIRSKAGGDWGTIASMSKRLIFSFPAILLLPAFVGIATHNGILAQQQFTKSAQVVEYNSFTVKITFSQKAMDTLVAGKVTVIVAGYLSASPIPGTPKQYVDHVGEIGLGDVQKEIVQGAIATFASVKPTPAMMKWVDSSGPQLLINVYSGRSPRQAICSGVGSAWRTTRRLSRARASRFRAGQSGSNRHV